MEVGRVADMEEDKMANMVVGMVADKRRRGKKWPTWSWTCWPT